MYDLHIYLEEKLETEPASRIICYEILSLVITLRV